MSKIALAPVCKRVFSSIYFKLEKYKKYSNTLIITFNYEIFPIKKPKFNFGFYCYCTAKIIGNEYGTVTVLPWCLAGVNLGNKAITLIASSFSFSWAALTFTSSTCP